MTNEEIVEEFLNAVCDGGTPVATCDLCKKTWYHPEGEYMEEGEFERLIERHKKEPDKCGPAEFAVGFGYAFGRRFVYDCRCEGVRKHALVVWENRRKIMRFFTRVNEAQAAALKLDSEALSEAAGEEAGQ
jgi:hypothetical protein